MSHECLNADCQHCPHGKAEEENCEECGDGCELCGGTGEIPCMGYVYPNEPHMAMIETRKCECQINKIDTNDEN
jgi:hypothetical protein